MSEQKKMRIGIIGAGSIAHSAHFPVFSSFEDVEVAAVMNRTYEKAEQACRQYGFGKAVKTFDEFLNQDLDAAVLLTPKTVRKEYLVPLLEAKLDVLIEKPLASTMEECEYSTIPMCLSTSAIISAMCLSMSIRIPTLPSIL